MVDPEENRAICQFHQSSQQRFGAAYRPASQPDAKDEEAPKQREAKPPFLIIDRLARLRHLKAPAYLGARKEHVALGRTPLRVSRLGVRVDSDHAGPVNELALAELSMGEFRAAIAIVRCPRAELLSKEELIAQAERSL